MTVSDAWLPGQQLAFTGVGYEPKGQILQAGKPVALNDDLRRLLIAAGLCNNSKLLHPNGESPVWRILGDPTEAAMQVAARKAGVDLDEEQRQAPRWRELPFESRRKRMSTIHYLADRRLVYTKGAPREVLALCTRARRDGREIELDDALRAQIMQANDDYARNGLRVLAVAMRQVEQDCTDYRCEVVERDLTFLGLMAMMDPPRPEVSEAVNKCRRAGIRIVMITGDYGLTAESIARRIGIVRSAKPRIITGVELDALDDAALKQALQDEVIFARVAPEHKLKVVSAMQELGHVVAVTGDGVNAAPALKKANIGVAMGISGTDVAKEAAAMILTDDNFASIVNAIEEGRAVYANIRKFCTYIFTSNAPEAVPFILFALTRGRIPLALNVMHVLAIDLGTDIVPALALGAEPPEPGVMDRPPRSLKEHVVDGSLLRRAYLYLGPVQSVAAMAAFYFMYWTNGYWGQWIDLPASGELYRSATAMALAAVVTTQIGNLFSERSEIISAFKFSLFNNKMLWLGLATELTLVAGIVYAPFLQKFIGTSSFPLINWLFLFAWTPSLLLVDEIRKALVRAKMRRAARRQA